MAEHVRRLSEADTVLRNYTDDELVSLVATDLSSSGLERELASRLTYHKDNRKFCNSCDAQIKVR